MNTSLNPAVISLTPSREVLSHNASVPQSKKEEESHSSLVLTSSLTAAGHLVISVDLIGPHKALLHKDMDKKTENALG